MAEKGILFNGDMMRAIRADAKSQTRRPMKPQPSFDLNGKECWYPMYPCESNRAKHYATEAHFRKGIVLDFHPYAVGDLLYCLETFAIHPRLGTTLYRATAEEYQDAPGFGIWKPTWTPSIHMPKKYAREWLKVTAVRAEQGPDISNADALSEGMSAVCNFVDNIHHVCDCAADKFCETWKAIYGDDANWRWVTEFERKDDGEAKASS